MNWVVLLIFNLKQQTSITMTTIPNSLSLVLQQIGLSTQRQNQQQNGAFGPYQQPNSSGPLAQFLQSQRAGNLFGAGAQMPQ